MIEDKIREAVESMKNKAGVVCSECEFEDFCFETADYTGMNFCNNAVDQIIKKVNDTGDRQ